MPEIILKDADLTVNGIDLSAQVQQIALTYEANQEDASAMGDDTIRNVPALKNWSMDVTFKQDYAAGGVDDTLFPLVGAAAFTIILLAESGGVSASNPSFTGTAVLSSYSPLSGAHGALLQAPVSFVPGGGDLVRAVV